jgi:hypothetical protein
MNWTTAIRGVAGVVAGLVVMGAAPSRDTTPATVFPPYPPNVCGPEVAGCHAGPNVYPPECAYGWNCGHTSSGQPCYCNACAYTPQPAACNGKSLICPLSSDEWNSGALTACQPCGPQYPGCLGPE